MKDDVLDPSPRAGGGRGAARRRHRRLVAVAVCVALAFCAWALWHRAASRPPPRRAPSAMAAALARLRLGFVSSLGVDGRMRSVAASSLTSDRSASGPVAVCGVPGGVLLDDPAEAASAAEPASTAEAPAADASAASAPPVLALPSPTPAEQRIFDAMTQSSDAFARAAVLVLAPSGDPDDPAARLERLADSALHTSDPRVYALAYRACNGNAQTPPAACAELNVAQWVRLDGGNGAPWLYALGDAVRRGDTAAADDALFHIASAERIDDRYADVGAATIDQVPPDDDEATLAGWLLMARATSVAMPPIQALFTQCKGADDDANRRQLCATAADKLIDHGNSVFLASVGANLDRMVTGSAVRADRLHAERDALFATNTPLDFSCPGLRRNLHRFQRSAQIGELAALREASMQAASAPVGP